MNGNQSSGRKHGTLHTFLATLLDEAAEIGEVGEFLAIDSGLRADRKGLADLGDDDADFAGGDLHPGIFFDGIGVAQLPAQAGH